MKNAVIILLSALLSVAFTACNGGSDDAASKTENEKEVIDAAGAIQYMVNSSSSVLTWKGSKPVGDSHNGTLKVKEGTLDVADGTLKGGKIVFDMNSIVNIDLEDEEWNTKLVGHLKSPDFFNVSEFPSAEFELTDIKESADSSYTHTVSGNLKVKGITKNITFGANISTDANKITAKAEKVIIDRTEWDIRYNSGKFFEDLKDKLISDEIELGFEIIAEKK